MQCRNISKLDGRAPAAAQQLLEAAEQRIAAEGAINELEMSACHARLLEFERQQADWYKPVNIHCCYQTPGLHHGAEIESSLDGELLD